MLLLPIPIGCAMLVVEFMLRFFRVRADVEKPPIPLEVPGDGELDGREPGISHSPSWSARSACSDDDGLPIAFAFFSHQPRWLLHLPRRAGRHRRVHPRLDVLDRNFSLAPIPFFLLIGEILLRTGIAFRAVDAIDNAIRRVPGRLSVVAVTGGTVFSALSGSTIATTAMLGQALVPDMLRRGYHPTMAVGPIIAIGGVDMLIPPSNLAVIFATIASSLSIIKVSVAELLIAGTLPGLIMSAAFIVYIVVRCWWNPN